MKELARHIEIMLLDNDCVIIPGFGGFIAHQVSARYVPEEQLFLPPYRTIGFSPSMRLNDGLLVQSYMTAYDASFPEAVRLLESKVSMLENSLHQDGSVELHGIGILRENIKGEYTFEPNESGVLSPTLYGMSSFSMPTLEQLTKQQQEEAEKQKAAAKPILEPSFVNETDSKIIEMKHTRKEFYSNLIAAAVTLLIICLLALPFTNIGKSSKDMKKTLSEAVSEDNRSLLEKVVSYMTQSQIEPVQEAEIVEETKQEKSVEATAVTSETKTENSAAKTDKMEAATSYYTIVLASQVSKSNATKFIERLQKKDLDKAELLEGKFLRIIYGHYTSEGEAYAAVQELRGEDTAFKQCWVMKVQ